MLWLEILVGVLALLGVAGWVLLYLPFRRSPERRWRDQVLALAAEAKLWLLRDHLELQNLDTRRQVDERTLFEGAYLTYLEGVAVDQLEEYPGIGPATLARLRGAGYTSLAVLQTARLHRLELGKKRLADVSHAIQDLTQKLRSQFEAGACREAQELAGALHDLEQKYDAQQRAAHFRLQEVEAILEQLKGLEAVARRVTFWDYRRAGSSPLVPPSLLKTPLPDLHQALTAAEEEARPAVVPRALATPDGDLFASHPAPPPPASSDGEQRAVPASRAEHLAVLEIDPAVPLSADLVRRQYHLLRERYVPEKLAPFGPDFVALARAKRAAVEAAANDLLGSLGARLEDAPPPAAPRDLRDNPDLDAVFGA
jgi:hypothetical protein